MCPDSLATRSASLAARGVPRAPSCTIVQEMALAPITPRDRLQRLVDLGTQDAALLVADGAVRRSSAARSSLAFALDARAKRYQSYGGAVLPGAHPVEHAVEPRGDDAAQHRRSLSASCCSRARSSLQIIERSEAEPVSRPSSIRSSRSTSCAHAIRFESRGAQRLPHHVHRLAIRSARRRSTAKLTKLLQDKDEALRNDAGAGDGRVRDASRRTRRRAELRKREQALAEFLAKHPEFVAGREPVAGRRRRHPRRDPATRAGRDVGTGNARLLRARAPAPAHPGAPRRAAGLAAGARRRRPPSPEQIAAEAAVADGAARARRRAARARGRASQSTPSSTPTSIKAQERVDAAQQQLAPRAGRGAARRRDAGRAGDAGRSHEAPEGARRSSRAQIADEQRRASSGEDAAPHRRAGRRGTNWVVAARDRARRAAPPASPSSASASQSLADSVFRAQIDASQKHAEHGGRLTVRRSRVQAGRAERPRQDDLLARRHGAVPRRSAARSRSGSRSSTTGCIAAIDIDQLGMPVLAVIPPRVAKPRSRAEGEAGDDGAVS